MLFSINIIDAKTCSTSCNPNGYTYTYTWNQPDGTKCVRPSDPYATVNYSISLTRNNKTITIEEGTCEVRDINC